MSRKLTRSIDRHRERQEQALAKYAYEKYGDKVQIADLHPDVKMLFALNFELAEASDGGNAVLVADAVALIVDFIRSYGGQKEKAVDTAAVAPV